MSWVKLYGGCSRTMQQYTPRQPPTNSACPSLFKKTLTDLLALATIAKTSIDKYFPAARLYAPFKSSIDAIVEVSPALYTRIIWAEQNESIKYDTSSAIHIYQLKDIYIQCGLDWTKDPVLKHT
jgi:hypothetical protein